MYSKFKGVGMVMGVFWGGVLGSGRLEGKLHQQKNRSGGEKDTTQTTPPQSPREHEPHHCITILEGIHNATTWLYFSGAAAPPETPGAATAAPKAIRGRRRCSSPL